MNDKLRKYLIIGLVSFMVCWISGFILACFTNNYMNFRIDLRLLLCKETVVYTFILMGLALIVALLYYYKHYWLLNGKKLIKGKKGDLHFDANLEESRFLSDREVEMLFQTVNYHKLELTDIKGIPIKAEEVNGNMNVTFSPPSHVLCIGTTGSGKTTTFVEPSIQILSTSKTKPSLFISDPKGELYANHSMKLEEEGYEVKVLDLRNPYNSIRWNPLERAYEYFQRAHHLDKEVIVDEENATFEFDGEIYDDQMMLESALQVKKQQLLDTVYEDLNDVCTAICPINNKNEPMWESGAKNLVLAICLAMLEDSLNPECNLTKDKYNFYSVTKVATNTEDECANLLAYFKNRSPLSKAVSLSKQVLDASDKTRGSYLSSTFDKLSMFSDLSLCALTSENEVEFASMGEKPIALFLQIPDEKETRHTLASLVILQAYKELVDKANKSENLTLPRPVYFLLDEFGNLPKIHKLESMITVGRSRNIWLNLIVQSYAQLSKVYDDKSAEIIKSNCNVQMFIGTTDQKTIEEFSKRLGNFTMAQRSMGFNSVRADDVNSNTSVKERPLVYPSELARLNSKEDMGNTLITVFGYYPIKSKFTPSFRSNFYEIKKVEQKLMVGRFFDEDKAYYDMKKRNSLFSQNVKRPSIGGSIQPQTERRKIQLILEQIKQIVKEGTTDVIPEDEQKDLLDLIENLELSQAYDGVKRAMAVAKKSKRHKEYQLLQDACVRLKDYMSEGQREKI